MLRISVAIILAAVAVGVVQASMMSTCYSGECQTNPEWNYSLYVTRWPGTYTQDKVPSYVNSFTIHGIWPTLYDNDYPCNCKGPQFNATTLDPILQPLREAWYDFDGPNSTGLWSHEWDKHGNCACDAGLSFLTDELQFFNMGITLHTNIPTMEYLSKAGINPSNTKDYNVTEILQHITDAVGTTPVIECAYQNHQSQLSRVAYCLDKNFKVMDCPSCIVNQYKKSANCDQFVYIPDIN